MKRQEIAQKLDEMVKGMPGTFYVHNDGDLNLEWDGSKIASFKDWNCGEIILDLSKKFSPEEQETITKFTESATELIKEKLERYTVEVIEGRSDGYLNLNVDNGGITLSDDGDYGNYKAQFTKSELKKLKNRKDIHIDWDRAIVDKVESEEF